MIILWDNPAIANAYITFYITSYGFLAHLQNYEKLILRAPYTLSCGPGSCQYSHWLRAGRFGDRIPVGARFSAPVQTDPGAHPASCTMGTGSFPGVKSGRGVTLTPHPLLVPWSWKGRAIPLLPQWAVRPVQSQCLYKGALYIFYLIFLENLCKSQRGEESPSCGLLPLWSIKLIYVTQNK